MRAVAPPVGVMLDSSALLALGRGNRMISRWVSLATRTGTVRVYAPAMCVAAAVSERAELGEHIGGLLAIEVVDLTFAGADLVGRLIAAGTDWQGAHAVVAAMSSAEWPEGLPVATATPDAYAKHHVGTVDVRSPP